MPDLVRVLLRGPRRMGEDEDTGFRIMKQEVRREGRQPPFQDSHIRSVDLGSGHPIQ